jgi:transposase InsO family protein
MKKEEIRKEFFKLRVKRHSYSQCRRILKAKWGYEVTIRTLKRWSKRLKETKWDLRDESKRPKTVHTKITPEIEKKVISIRKKTGWGEYKIEAYHPELGISHTAIYEILNRHKLCKQSKRKKRVKYVRFQREHPNSMWQVDISAQKIKGRYCLAVIDDCERYCIGLFALNRVTTAVITKLLDDLIKKHGKPREILTDNGSVFGGRNKHSKFDRWCRRRGIKHIRTAIHSPTTVGKVERFFQTLAKELKFCNNDPELFRMRYNHFRPHSSLENKTPAEIYFAFKNLF